MEWLAAGIISTAIAVYSGIRHARNLREAVAKAAEIAALLIPIPVEPDKPSNH